MEGTLEQRGIIPRVVDKIFESIDESSENIEFELKVSVMEIYKEEIKDLLDINNKNLKLRSEKPSGVLSSDPDLRRKPDHGLRRFT
jgi:kinesin family protein 5